MFLRSLFIEVCSGIGACIASFNSLWARKILRPLPSVALQTALLPSPHCIVPCTL